MTVNEQRRAQTEERQEPGEPGQLRWWLGVGAVVGAVLVLVVPTPSGVFYYEAMTRDGVNTLSGPAFCGPPVLGAWTIGVDQASNEGTTLVGVEPPYPPGVEEDPLRAVQDTCRRDAAWRLTALLPGLVFAGLVSYARMRHRSRDFVPALSDRGDGARFALAGLFGLIAWTSLGTAPAVYFLTVPVALLSAVLAQWMVQDLKGLPRLRLSNFQRRAAVAIALPFVILLSISAAL